MPPPLSVTTPKSTLFHACLAHLSPDVHAIDDILRDPAVVPRLPSEILLLVREHLFPIVAESLLRQSTAALDVYERSLRNLLCADCVEYNLDIYGPNIWQWEQFTGACSCLEIESPAMAAHRQLHGRHRQRPHKSLSPPPNPKQFTDAHQWLECYLSSQTTIDIWHTVSNVLRDFNCDVVRDSDDPSSSSTLIRLANGQFRYRRDFVKVIPSRHLLLQSDAYLPKDTRWQAQAALSRAIRELALQSAEPFGSHNRDVPLSKRRSWRSSVSREQHIFNILLRIIASIAAACFSLPLTFATVALTVFCFYSRPRSLRII